MAGLQVTRRAELGLDRVQVLPVLCFDAEPSLLQELDPSLAAEERALRHGAAVATADRLQSPQWPTVQADRQQQSPPTHIGRELDGSSRADALGPVCCRCSARKSIRCMIPGSTAGVVKPP
jgi:hypothetical protein